MYDEISKLNELIQNLEDNGDYIQANVLHDIFIKKSSKFNKIHNVPFEMNLDDALNVYDSNTYEVDSTGEWEETESISEFREEASDQMMHFPAAVDDNHLIFYDENKKEIEVMNMIPKHHLDSLHNNPDKTTKWVKRAAVKDVDSEEELSKIINLKKMSWSCNDAIKFYKNLIKSKFGIEELKFIVVSETSKQHIEIEDLKTNKKIEFSCHYLSSKGKFHPKASKVLIDMIWNSIKFRENEYKRKTFAEFKKWIKYGPSNWKKIDESSDYEQTSMEKEADLRDWFKKEKWVDVSRPKKDGKWQPCGRGDTSKGKKPVCTPVNKAKSLTEKERKNRIRQKRKKEKEPNPDKKPNITKYTEQAGGKSNVSNSTNKFYKLSGIEDEGGLTGAENPPFEIPSSSFEDRDKTIREIKELTKNHSAIDYIVNVYDEMVQMMKNALDSEAFQVLINNEINIGNEAFDNYYHDTINLLCKSVLDPYDQTLQLFLDLFKKVSKEFNVFDKENYDAFLFTMMTEIIKFEMGLKSNKEEK